MKARHVLFGVLILGTGWLTSVVAGERSDNRGQLRERLRQALNLSAEQQEQLQAGRRDLRQKFQQIRAQVEEGTLSREEARAQFRTERQAQKTLRDGILNDEQQALLERAREHIKSQKGERRGAGRHGARRGARRLLKALELTDEQQEQVRELRLQTREQRKQWHESEQRPSKEERDQVRQERRQAFEDILTEAQRDKLAELRQARQERRWEGTGENSSTSALEAIGGEDAPTSVEEQSWGKIKENIK